ncbi:MAG TPA: hypothetical protein VND64_31455 [Pirellulales bacterium]|nr:hypothetical protein [Pirellulales bacterium]
MIAVLRVFTFAMLTALALAVPVACQAGGPRRWSDLNRHPQIVRYNPATDTIMRQESVLTKSLVNIPGGKESYSGNRLRQYRFLGKPGRGGIYDAFSDYPKTIGADVKNYKFRLR